MGKYNIENIEYPSVTTIIKDVKDPAPLIQWAANCCVQYIRDNSVFKGRDDEYNVSQNCLNKARLEFRNVSKEACNIGSEVHRLISLYIISKVQGDIKQDFMGHDIIEIENGFKAFLQWEKENIKQWYKSEHSIISKNYGYAGTLDATCQLVSGQDYIIDFKSSKGFYSDMKLQIAAYLYAYNEMNEKQIDNMGILRLDKLTGQPEFKDYTKDYKKSINAFINLVRYYYIVSKRRLKNNPFVDSENLWDIK